MPDPSKPSKYQKRIDKKVDKAKAKNELIKAKEANKSTKSSLKSTRQAEKADILKSKKDNRQKRTADTISAVRTKNVNIKGDRRLIGNNNFLFLKQKKAEATKKVKKDSKKPIETTPKPTQKPTPIPRPIPRPKPKQPSKPKPKQPYKPVELPTYKTPPAKRDNTIVRPSNKPISDTQAAQQRKIRLDKERAALKNRKK